MCSLGPVDDRQVEEVMMEQKESFVIYNSIIQPTNTPSLQLTQIINNISGHAQNNQHSMAAYVL